MARQTVPLRSIIDPAFTPFPYLGQGFRRGYFPGVWPTATSVLLIFKNDHLVSFFYVQAGDYPPWSYPCTTRPTVGTQLAVNFYAGSAVAKTAVEAVSVANGDRGNLGIILNHSLPTIAHRVARL